MNQTQYINTPSAHFDSRKKGLRPIFIILHSIEAETLPMALKLLEKHEVSAHYVVDERGNVSWLVDEAMRAWHAGVSSWHGDTDINSMSIGIEMINSNRDDKEKIYPEKQIESVLRLCKDIMDRNNILPQNVIAHSDIAPDRKEDPGELFPWSKFAEEKIGLWHSAKEEDIVEAYKILEDEEALTKLFKKFGYTSDVDFKTLVTAFQRHYEPEIFAKPEEVGKINVITAGRLVSLVRQKEALNPAQRVS